MLGLGLGLARPPTPSARDGSALSRIGAVNGNRSASGYFGGTVRRIAFGRVSPTLAQFNAIRSEWLIAFQKFPGGDLPPPADPDATWGKDGLISAAEAAAAVSGANLQVYSVSGDVVPFDFCAAIVEGRGLAFVPEPAL